MQLNKTQGKPTLNNKMENINMEVFTPVINPKKIETQFSGKSTIHTRAGSAPLSEKLNKVSPPLFELGKAYTILSADCSGVNDETLTSMRSMMSRALTSENLQFVCAVGAWKGETELVFIVETGESIEYNEVVPKLHKLACAFMQDAVMAVDSEGGVFINTFIERDGTGSLVDSDIEFIGTLYKSDDLTVKPDNYTYDIKRNELWLVKLWEGEGDVVG